MASMMEESAVVALEGLYSGPMKVRELAQAREIFAFLRANGQGKVLEKVPSVDGGASVLDIVALFGVITSRGGVRRVQEQSLWKEVMTGLGYPFDRQTLFAVSKHYKNFLYGYEQTTLGARADIGGQQKSLPPQAQPPPPQQQQQARVGQVGGVAQPFDQYQRHLRQREFEKQQQHQQQQLRHQRQMELQQKMQKQRREEQQRKEEEEQEQKRKLQEKQRFLVKQQQQQQLQMEQDQLFHHQQQRQQAQNQMILKQQQQQQQQHQYHRAQAAPYQAPPHRHGTVPKPPGDDYHATNAFKLGNPRMRSAGPGGVSASIPRADLPKALKSKNSPREVVAAVNTLTLETYDAPEELMLEAIPGLLDAIFDLMDSLNPAVTQVISLAQTMRAQIPKGTESTPALLDASFKCAERPGGLCGDCFSGLPPSGKGELLLLLLNALRNASFVPSNERVIGHNVRAIQHFVTLCLATSPEPAVFAATLDLFGRVTKHVDIWGTRAAETDYEGCKWAEDSLSYLAPAHVRMVTTSASAGGGGGGITSPSALEYVSSVALVFPTLVSMVDDEDRSRVLSGLAILSKLSQMETNKEAFDRVPDCFLERLVELLSIPKMGCDVLATKAGVSSQEWLEYNCRVLHSADAGSDEEVRDSALEVMSLLAGISDSLRSRLGIIPGCARTLTDVVLATTRGIRIDPQARRMAALTLTSLGTVESNHPGMRPLYSDLLVAAARDSQAAELLFHGLKTVFPFVAA